MGCIVKYIALGNKMSSFRIWHFIYMAQPYVVAINTLLGCKIAAQQK